MKEKKLESQPAKGRLQPATDRAQTAASVNRACESACLMHDPPTRSEPSGTSQSMQKG